MAHCAKCEAELPLIDGELPGYCAVCGLPQLRISEAAVLTESDAVPGHDATGAAGMGAGGPSAVGAGIDPANEVDWRHAVMLCAAAAAAVALPTLLIPGSIAYGGAAGPALVFLPPVAVLTVVLYHRRQRIRGMDGRVGARIGALAGLLLAATLLVAVGAGGFYLRYFREDHTLEQALAQSIDQAVNNLSAANAAAMTPDVRATLHSPEVRAGWYVLAQALLASLLVFAGAVFGAATGAVLRLRRQRMTGR